MMQLTYELHRKYAAIKHKYKHLHSTTCGQRAIKNQPDYNLGKKFICRLIIVDFVHLCFIIFLTYFIYFLFLGMTGRDVDQATFYDRT